MAADEKKAEKYAMQQDAAMRAAEKMKEDRANKAQADDEAKAREKRASAELAAIEEEKRFLARTRLGFNKLDADGSGLLDRAEIFEALESLLPMTWWLSRRLSPSDYRWGTSAASVRRRWTSACRLARSAARLWLSEPGSGATETTVTELVIGGSEVSLMVSRVVVSWSAAESWLMVGCGRPVGVRERPSEPLLRDFIFA